MRTTYQNISMRFRVFFAPKTQNVMAFSGSVNGTTKNPDFFILVFANVNGPSFSSQELSKLDFKWKQVSDRNHDNLKCHCCKLNIWPTFERENKILGKSVGG